MTTLVLGASGQVATHLRELLPNAVYWGREAFDLGVRSDLASRIEKLGPSLIVNAAAYTTVDKAESEPALAWRINAEAPAAAASAARVLDIGFVHISTDYIFDGRKQVAYQVSDAFGPVNVYGASKLAGELAARAICPKHWILRTSWVFSEHGTNFLKTILRLASNNRRLSVVGDQRGRPTYAGHLATLIAGLTTDGSTAPPLPYGTFHAVGGPPTTWFDFAETIVNEAHRQGLIQQVPEMIRLTTSEYPLQARRPPNSVLEPSADLGSSLDWRDAVGPALERLNARRDLT